MRSVLSCQGFQIYVGETDEENVSLCRHAFPDDIWVHLSERASPHAVVSIGDLKLLPAQEERCRRTRDGRKELDLTHTIYEAALLVKFFSDAREEDDTSAVYTRVDSLLSHEANKCSGGAVYDVLAGCTTHYDDEFGDMPGRVVITRMPHFYRVEYDEHRVMQLLARSERSGSVANLDQEFAAWKETMLRREAASRRDWYLRRSYGEEIFQDESENDSEEENGDIVNLHSMAQNGEHHVHDDIDDMSVEQKDGGLSDSDEGHNCGADDNKLPTSKSEEENSEGAQPTEKVEVQRVVEMKTEHGEKDKSTHPMSDEKSLTKTREPSFDRIEHENDEDRNESIGDEADNVNYRELREAKNEFSECRLEDELKYNKTRQSNSVVENPSNLNVAPETKQNENENEKCRNVVEVVEKDTNNDRTENAESTSDVLEKRVLDATENKAS
ncbi:unnamed protein product [Agarophyton chilense]